MSKKRSHKPNKREIWALWKATGLTKKDLSLACGVTESAIKKWFERGNIPDEQKIRLANLAKSSKAIKQKEMAIREGVLIGAAATALLKNESITTDNAHRTEGTLNRETVGLDKLSEILPTVDDNVLLYELARRGWEVTVKRRNPKKSP